MIVCAVAAACAAPPRCVRRHISASGARLRPLSLLRACLTEQYKEEPAVGAVNCRGHCDRPDQQTRPAVARQHPGRFLRRSSNNRCRSWSILESPYCVIVEHPRAHSFTIGSLAGSSRPCSPDQPRLAGLASSSAESKARNPSTRALRQDSTKAIQDRSPDYERQLP